MVVVTPPAFSESARSEMMEWSSAAWWAEREKRFQKTGSRTVRAIVNCVFVVVVVVFCL